MDLGDFPKDNNQVVDAMLKDLAGKTGSDWYDLQSPSSSKAPSSRGRSGSSSSTGSVSPRNSMSSVVTTTTYVDGVPVVQVINEIPPTPESEDGPARTIGDATTPVVVTPTASEDTELPPPVPPRKDNKTPEIAATTSSNVASALTASDASTATHSSPFMPQSSYKPATSYQPGHDAIDGRKSPRPRPQSGEHHPSTQAPHPLMMRYPPGNLQQQQQQQQQPFRPLYPPGRPGSPPMVMPMPMPMPMPVHMSMPIPHIPDSSDNDGNRRHSQPIAVSFPLRPSSTSPTLAPVSSSTTSTSQPPRPPQQLPPRNPQAIMSEEEEAAKVPTNTYDGPPPDYAEAAMRPPAEKLDEKRRR